MRYQASRATARGPWHCVQVAAPMDRLHFWSSYRALCGVLVRHHALVPFSAMALKGRVCPKCQKALGDQERLERFEAETEP